MKTKHQTIPPKLPNDRFEYWVGRLAYLTDQNKHLGKRLRQKLIQRDLNAGKATLIAFPEPRQLIKRELKRNRLLGTTPDGKEIYLLNYKLNSSVIREIGRLREIAFRQVGEGTNKPRDIDRFDKTYKHLVLWDDAEQEIAGAYRIGEAGKLYEKYGIGGLYTSTLFDYQPTFIDLLPNAIELGRSFVQPKYWGKRSLDYLWLGLGAYLKANPSIHYLFGAVSLSDDFSKTAKNNLIALYSRHFQPSDHTDYAKARNPFRPSLRARRIYAEMGYKEGFKHLKSNLKQQNLAVPTLYKQYAEFCKPEATKFIDFNIDQNFSNCIDSLVLSDLRYIKKRNRKRYLDVSG